MILVRAAFVLLAVQAVTGCAPAVEEATPAAAASSGTEPAPAATAAPQAPAASAAAPAPAARPVVPVAVPPDIAALVAAPDRSDADRALDAGRHPGELLAFFGVAPGMRVAELLSGSGYSAELLARRVGPSGQVFGMNTPWLLEKFAQKPWTERLAKPVMKNVVRVDREFDDPLPPEARDLDLVLVSLVYHDLVWMNVDRDKLNAAVFRALKPGGVYAIVDHSGRAGTGTSEVKTLHRIEESVVRAEIERAGFTLAAEGDFLRNPNDARDWNDSPMAAAERRGTSDRFALKYVKPAR